MILCKMYYCGTSGLMCTELINSKFLFAQKVDKLCFSKRWPVQVQSPDTCIMLKFSFKDLDILK